MEAGVPWDAKLFPQDPLLSGVSKCAFALTGAGAGIEFVFLDCERGPFPFNPNNRSRHDET